MAVDIFRRSCFARSLIQSPPSKGDCTTPKINFQSGR
nr:MAG TPA: hypothetical protein [Caudoviricetes sp.]